MEFCQMIFTEVISRWTWFVGFVLSIMAKVSPIIDDSISIIAGLVGLAGGIVWVFVLIVKRKKEKVELEIKEIELQRLKDER